MTDQQRKEQNLFCLEFIHTVLEGDVLAAWANKRDSFTQMPIESVINLSKVTDMAASDLVLQYGFGIESTTVAELKTLMDQECEGCGLSKVAIAA